MNALPLPLLLALNGTIMILLAAMLGSAVLYLLAKLREYGGARDVYIECKGALALVTFLIGLEIRTAGIWYVQMLQHAGTPASETLLAVTTALMIVGAIPMAWGCICWIRVVLPYKCRPWTWAAIAGAALAFGVGVALWW